MTRSQTGCRPPLASPEPDTERDMQTIAANHCASRLAAGPARHPIAARTQIAGLLGSPRRLVWIADLRFAGMLSRRVTIRSRSGGR